MKNHADNTKIVASVSQEPASRASAREEKLARALKRNLQRRKQAAGRNTQADA